MFNPSVALAAYLIHWSVPGSRTAEQAWDDGAVGSGEVDGLQQDGYA